MHVPTVVSYSSLQQLVAGSWQVWSSCIRRSSSFFPEQHFLPSVEQIIDTPDPGRGDSGGLQGFYPGHGSLQRTDEHIVDIPVPGGGPHGFLPEQGFAASSFLLPEELLHGFFFSHFSP